METIRKVGVIIAGMVFFTLAFSLMVMWNIIWWQFFLILLAFAAFLVFFSAAIGD
jgi:hypothetical protein